MSQVKIFLSVLNTISISSHKAKSHSKTCHALNSKISNATHSLGIASNLKTLALFDTRQYSNFFK